MLENAETCNIYIADSGPYVLYLQTTANNAAIVSYIERESNKNIS
jgi:hypothetical protein